MIDCLDGTTIELSDRNWCSLSNLALQRWPIFLPLKYFFIFNINNHDLQDAANSPGDLAGSPVSLQAVLSAAVPRLPQHLRPRQGTAHAVHHG